MMAAILIGAGCWIVAAAMAAIVVMFAGFYSDGGLGGK